MRQLATMLGKIWEYIREASGENDYARYFARAARQGEEPLSRRAFYLSQLEHKHSRPNRCC
jgi:Selenoprotein, putative